MTYPLLSVSPFRWIFTLTESSLPIDSQVLNFKNSWNNVTYFVCKSIKIWRLIKDGASWTVKIHQKDVFTDISYIWFSVRKISTQITGSIAKEIFKRVFTVKRATFLHQDLEIWIDFYVGMQIVNWVWSTFAAAFSIRPKFHLRYIDRLKVEIHLCLWFVSLYKDACKSQSTVIPSSRNV